MKKEGHIPQFKRKKILLLCDDIRVHSGVATIAKEMVLNTSQHFNWVNMAGAIKHPEQGKKLDLSIDFFDAIMMGREKQTEYLATIIEKKCFETGLDIMILG